PPAPMGVKIIAGRDDQELVQCVSTRQDQSPRKRPHHEVEQKERECRKNHAPGPSLRRAPVAGHEAPVERIGCAPVTHRLEVDTVLVHEALANPAVGAALSLEQGEPIEEQHAMPRADLIGRFKTEMDQSVPCKSNPLGVKGVGELGTIGATPALVNAVADALARAGFSESADALQMPLSAPRLWQLLHR
ncbi:MAG: hypothetical protein RLY32_922, partial [Pseudomonadota bacterium]